MDLIDACTRLVIALAGLTTLMAAADQLVQHLAALRSVIEDQGDTPTESDLPAYADAPR